MQSTNVTKMIAKYIDDNNISLERIERDTRVSIKKLIINSNENLNATEFLDICYYLNIDPLLFKRN